MLPGAAGACCCRPDGKGIRRSWTLYCRGGFSIPAGREHDGSRGWSRDRPGPRSGRPGPRICTLVTHGVDTVADVMTVTRSGREGPWRYRYAADGLKQGSRQPFNAPRLYCFPCTATCVPCVGPDSGVSPARSEPLKATRHQVATQHIKSAYLVCVGIRQFRLDRPVGRQSLGTCRL